MKTAAAYIRVSTDDQTEYSPQSQIEMIRRYAKTNDYTVPEEYIYIEEGISGKTVEKRPQFMKMIGTAKAVPKPFDAILLWKFSRFARNREDSIVYKSMLRKQLGIEVISVSESLGDDKMSILFEAMIEAMDEYYSINLAEEVRRGMTERARRGEYNSSAPFGYTMQNKELVPHPDEAPIIHKVFEDYSKGEGMLHIAKNLNAMGIHTHRGNKIENRTVEYWLNNPVYNGKTRWTPTGAAGRNCHHPDSIIVQGKHAAIIDDALWESVQSRIRQQKEIYRKYYHSRNGISHWLVGLIHCGICSGPVVNCAGYMYCNNRGKGTCTGNGGISVKVLEEAVIQQLEKILNSNLRINYIQGSAAVEINKSNNIIFNQIEIANRKLRRVKAAYENGIDTIDEYRENKDKIQDEIRKLKAQIKTASIAEHTEQNRKIKRAVTAALPLLKDHSVPAIEKNSIARVLIRDIIKGGRDGREMTVIFRELTR